MTLGQGKMSNTTGIHTQQWKNLSRSGKKLNSKHLWKLTLKSLLLQNPISWRVPWILPFSTENILIWFSYRTFDLKPTYPSSLTTIWMFLLWCRVLIIWIAVNFWNKGIAWYQTLSQMRYYWLSMITEVRKRFCIVSRPRKRFCILSRPCAYTHWRCLQCASIHFSLTRQEHWPQKPMMQCGRKTPWHFPLH